MHSVHERHITVGHRIVDKTQSKRCLTWHAIRAGAKIQNVKEGKQEVMDLHGRPLNAHGQHDVRMCAQCARNVRAESPDVRWTRRWASKVHTWSK